MNSTEAENVLKMVRKTTFDAEFSDRYWRIEDMEAVQNERLQRNYDDFKNELKSLVSDKNILPYQLNKLYPDILNKIKRTSL